MPESIKLYCNCLQELIGGTRQNGGDGKSYLKKN